MEGTLRQLQWSCILFGLLWNSILDSGSDLVPALNVLSRPRFLIELIHYPQHHTHSLDKCIVLTPAG